MQKENILSFCNIRYQLFNFWFRYTGLSVSSSENLDRTKITHWSYWGDRMVLDDIETVLELHFILYPSSERIVNGGRLVYPPFILNLLGRIHRTYYRNKKIEFGEVSIKQRTFEITSMSQIPDILLAMKDICSSLVREFGSSEICESKWWDLFVKKDIQPDIESIRELFI